MTRLLKPLKLPDVTAYLIGGVLIGVFENLGIMVFSAGMRDIISFVFLVLVLLVKPEGLFTRRSK